MIPGVDKEQIEVLTPEGWKKASLSLVKGVKDHGKELGIMIELGDKSIGMALSDEVAHSVAIGILVHLGYKIK